MTPTSFTMDKVCHGLLRTLLVFVLGSGLASPRVATAAATPAWNVIPAANVAGIPTNALYGTSCVSVDDCWAVGTATDASHLGHPLTEHWDGAAWSLVAAPEVAGKYNALSAVSCPASNSCLAVGYYYDPASSLTWTFAERWNGTRWSIVPTADVTSPTNDALWSVSCASPADCWATGSGVDATSGFKQTLVEHSTGAGLAIVTSPNASMVSDNALDGVTCLSPTLCWAVGSYKDPSNSLLAQTLIERWDGSSWSQVLSADTLPTEDNLLDSVSCASATDCWAVGNYYNAPPLASSTSLALTEHWDGSRWSVVAGADPAGTQGDSLHGVACLAANDCRAVGQSFQSAGGTGTLVEQWNGASWSLAASANPNPTGYNALAAVACANARACFAGGYSLGGSTVASLVEATNRPPTVSLAASPASGTAPLAVGFAATGTDPDAGDAQALLYSYDLDGDGTFEVPFGTATTPQRTFTTPGDYTVGVRVKDLAGDITGASAKVHVDPSSPTLAPFTFAARTNVPDGAFVTSEAVTLGGTSGASFPVGVSGGNSMQYSLNGAAFTSAAGTIAIGDRLVVRHLAAGQDDTSVTTSVSVGAYTTSFMSTTGKSLDTVPDAFDFGETDNVTPGTQVTSRAVTPTAYDSAQVVAGPGMSYSINGGAFTSAGGTITKGQTITARLTSTGGSLFYTKGYISIGGVRDGFVTRTRK